MAALRIALHMSKASSPGFASRLIFCRAYHRTMCKRWIARGGEGLALMASGSVMKAYKHEHAIACGL
jgi:hypothetical protein